MYDAYESREAFGSALRSQNRSPEKRRRLPKPSRAEPRSLRNQMAKPSSVKRVRDGILQLKVSVNANG